MSRISDRSRIPPRLWRVALALIWALVAILVALGLCQIAEIVLK